MQFKAMCLVCKIVSLLLLSHSSSGCSDPLTNTQLCTSSYIISGVHKFCFHIRPTVLNLIKKKRIQVIEMPCYYGYCICSVSTTHCEFRTPESHTKNQKKQLSLGYYMRRGVWVRAQAKRQWRQTMQYKITAFLFLRA